MVIGLCAYFRVIYQCGLNLFVFSLYYCILQVKENPGPINGGLAPLYGAAGRMPDRGMVQELLVDYMDGTC